MTSESVGDRWKVKFVAGFDGEPAGLADELVGHQVVADEGHPPGDRRVSCRQFEHVALSIEDGGDVAGERQSGAVRAPAAERSADADPVVGGEDAVGMTNGAGLDRERDAPGGRVDEGEGRRELVVVGRVGGVQGDRPVEDRLVRRDGIRDRRTGEPVAGEVLVGVDETRHHEASGAAQPRRRLPASLQLGGRCDVDDSPAVHGHGTVADHRPRRVHRQHPLALDQQIDAG